MAWDDFHQKRSLDVRECHYCDDAKQSSISNDNYPKADATKRIPLRSLVFPGKCKYLQAYFTLKTAIFSRRRDDANRYLTETLHWVPENFVNLSKSLEASRANECTSMSNPNRTASTNGDGNPLNFVGEMKLFCRPNFYASDTMHATSPRLKKRMRKTRIDPQN